MSRADEYFISMCRDILEHGTTTEGQKVRPHWPDGTPAYTIKKFGVVTRYDLAEEFPVVTLRPTPVKSALDELLWIWQKKSNNIHDLHSGVWDEWADADGTIGRAYGYQMAVKHRYHDISEAGLSHAFGESVPDALPETDSEADQLTPEDADRLVRFRGNGSEEPAGAAAAQEPGRGGAWTPAGAAFVKAHAVRGKDGYFYMDQVDRVIYDLKNNPYSRRILTSIYTFSDLHAMNLHPCAYSMTFNVTQRPGHEKMTLNGILNQRSQDILTAFAWNEWQYAALLSLMAQACDMEAGEFLHVVADAHIYDRHVDTIRELIARTPQSAPKVWINPEKHDFYAFTRDDMKLINYVPAGPQIREIPVAI